MKKEKIKYYSLASILKENADYNVIFGERSNGKTTAVLRYALEDYINSGYVNQLALFRRWAEDFKGKNGSQMFSAIVSLGWIEELTGGKFNTVTYYSQKWYLAKFDENGEKEYSAPEPFCLGFSIASEEHYKSTAYPNVKTILFDEFITRSYYLPNEFILFQNLLSTVIRLRDDVKIFMCGNTINQYCPYFNEMGLINVRKQRPGTIDVYTYGDTELKVAVEYSYLDNKKSKLSNKYFAFNNPKLSMITNGNWEISIYPHLPVKYNSTEIKYIYYIKFDENLLQCEIILSKELKTLFTYIHAKTTPIKENNRRSIVFDTNPNVKPNYRRKITKPTDEISKLIYSFFVTDKVFYQSNDIGEIVRNYIIWCKKESI